MHTSMNLSNVAPARLSQYLAPENASLTEKREAELQRIMREYQRFEGDTGSSEVQGACQPYSDISGKHQATGCSFVEKKFDALFLERCEVRWRTSIPKAACPTRLEAEPMHADSDHRAASR